ncbi:myotubularin-related protein 3-like isoform X2 [Cynoglossus semilaevis]|uniref:myotubularin-related protein 3-like isoform X2 n=1 Tax=Cynoglossus semilaevis TaxID=244447 RepID=UPI000D6241FB|nr:myotubularin-related protein 3-like isoform X2 [Cynoglossus semilaevis]XP_024908635.1 myotubularin-related protein 3-like isoform X2 [Cynoglossus semilaevis]XP_024908636.1 myotubularin-related protein 3-like isoform X2 [Cynoglossus semilaevis]
MRRDGKRELSKNILYQLQEEEGQSSLECIQANQIFPKKSPILEEENMQVPFPELHGEFTEYVGRAEDAIIAMSNYRLHIKFKESIINVPLQLIESVECRDMFQLHLTCKDCKVVRCQFSTFEQCQEWLKRLSVVVRPPSRLEDLFSFAFHAWCMEVYAGEKEQHGELCRPGEHVISWFKNEVERMSFDTQNAWRMSDINSKFRLCPSYPQQLLVPACITDKELENVAAFRSWKRFPAVVYRHISTGAVIARCGQPEVSWWGWRNADDEHLVQSIAKACAVNSSPHKHVQNSSYTNGSDLPDTEFESSMTNSTEVETLVIQPHKLLILDARSYAAAVANRAKGGGCECPEYYPNCEVVFMGMANIHSIRKSFQSLSFLCTQMPDPANWLSALESTKWLQHLSLLLKAALLVVNAVDRDHRPVLVHCSDGWDRTPQIVALSKLLLDPYYRTVEGFQVLVETDWLDFGHKFADRCGHGESSEDLNERCPVFLQWLDSVHQLQRQFPCSFEFNEAFLVKLVQHTYSCLFGTFLCNSGKEREDRHVQERTCSVWSLLRPANRTLRNMLYSSHSETVLHPVCHVRNLMLWSAVYLPSSSPTTLSDDSCAPYPVPGANPQDTPLARYTKTRSFDSLPSACELGQSMAPNRRSSDPNLNEKWQDHRRSLEINIAVGPDGEGNQDQEPLSNGAGLYTDMVDSELDESLEQKSSHTEQEHDASVSPESLGDEAELSVAVGVAEGQMQNILQEATKKEVAADQREDSVTAADVVTAVDKESGRDEKVGEEQESTKVNASEILTESVLNGHCPESDLTDGAKDKEAYILPPLVSERAEKPDNQTGHVTQTPEEVVTQAGENSSMEEEVTHGPSESDSPEHEQPAAHRTITNGFVDRPPEGLGQDQEEMCPDCEPDQGICEPVDKRVSVLESSTETLTEEACSRLEHAIQPPSLLSRPPCIDGRSRPPCSRRERAIDTSERSLGITLNGGTKRPPVGAFQSASIDLDRDGLCNGENSEGEPGGAPHWPAGNGQLSLASCNSLILHQWGSCSQHHWCHTMMSQAAMSPEQPSRNHLDDDGLTLHTDAIQQRLRQIEAGHQMEVDTLKKQVQELWSRLEMQQNTGSQRINGDMGDEMTSMTDSEYNLDPNCLSHCSTELFSVASREQVDKQNTEVTRWYPDHLAAQCYGCDSRFWLATRKHHCSGKEPVQELWNCGNVFCASCCDQKIPVPSQQLFEPSRVCKSCYGSLHLSSVPLDLEKPITACSN